MKVAAILLIAGSSSRFKSSTPKQLFSLKGKPVFSYSLNAFKNNKNIDDIIVVVNKENEKTLSNLKDSKVKITLGGKTRQESVKKGLAMLNLNDNDIIIIHDGARPLIDEKIINNIIKETKKYDAVSTFIKVEDTISKVDSKGYIDNFVDRNQIVKIQTPQAFKFGLIKKAHDNAKNLNATDDCTLVKNIGVKVRLIEGNKKLTKLTTLEDVKYLESLIENE